MDVLESLMQASDSRVDKLRQVVSECAHLAVEIHALSNSDDLYDAGLTSLNTVNLMLAIEDCFDCEFPEEMLTRETFQSVDSILDAVRKIAS